MATHTVQHIPVEQYLETEATSLDRHEYCNGEIFLMASGTPAHSQIASQINASLTVQLRETDCNVRGPDMGIRTAIGSLYSYADVVVSCAQEQFENNFLLNPVLIVEVLSQSTENYDRGKKFELYRQMRSFSEYMVVTQDRVYVEHHVRVDKAWIMHQFTDRETVIDLKSIPAFLRLSDVYVKVPFPAV